MKEQSVKQSAEQRFNEAFIKDVVEAVKNSSAPWQKSWDTNEINTPFNAKSKRFYSGRNVIRLALTAQQQGYIDPRWATFRQISELGGKVNKGEKGTSILYFKEEEAERKDGTAYTKKTIRSYSVFNLSQTDLEPYKVIDRRETQPDLQPFADILEKHQPKIADGEPAYRYTTDTIYLPPKAAFKDDAHYYATALHEMSHWTGHESRLDRNIQNKFGTPDYAKEELVAELSSYMTSLESGLPFNPTNSESYLKHWAEKTGDELEESLSTAFKEASAAQTYLRGQTREQVIDKKVNNKQSVEEIPQIQNFFTEVMYSEIDTESAKKSLGIKEKVYLAVPYEERNIAKEAGAKWDKSHKAWYVYNPEDNPTLKKYIPDFSAVQGGSTIEDFRIAAEQIGLDMSKANLDERGRQLRVPLQGKSSSNKSGEYKIFDNSDGTTGAYALNYVSGEKIKWSNRSNTKVPQEIYGAGRAKREQANEILSRVDKYVEEQRANLAHKAYLGLEAVNGNEPYITNKHIRNTHGLRRLDDDTVIVPLIDGNRITSLQAIKPDGEKRIMKQASKQGSYFPIGNRQSPSHVFMAEGVATAETIYQIVSPTYGDNVLVVAAIDSNNLPVVAEKLQSIYPQAEQFIAADNDIHNEQKGLKNSGIEAANKVALKNPAVTVVIPPVTTEADKTNGVDWNDYAAQHGIKKAALDFTELSETRPRDNQTQSNDKLIPLDGLSPREAGRKLFDATHGNIEQIDLITRSAQAAGLSVNADKLKEVKGKSNIEKANAFMAAISPKPDKQQTQTTKSWSK